jgi:hypothetical protein
LQHWPVTGALFTAASPLPNIGAGALSLSLSDLAPRSFWIASLDETTTSFFT